MHSKNISWSNVSLTVKLTLTVSFVVLITVISITLLSLWREQQNFRAELEQQATLLLDVLTVVIDDPLYTQDVDFISTFMTDLGKKSIVVSGRVYDRTGKIISDAYDSSAVMSIRADSFGERIIGSNTVVFDWQSEQLLAGKAVIIGRDHIGAISIGLSTAPLAVKLTTMRLQALGVGLVALLIGILLAFLLSRSIIGPLGELTRATKRIADGDLSYKNEIRSGDELATLAISFNAMTDQLRATLEDQAQQRLALVDANHKLEHMLTEITQAHQLQDSLVQTISELSTPVLRIAEGVVLVPLIGLIDNERSQQMMQRMLATIEHSRVQVAILDVSGVPMVDSQVATGILHTARAAQLLGARVLLCGITPEVAQLLVSVQFELKTLTSAADLQSALQIALSLVKNS